MELKVFWVTAFADTSHLGMLVAAENARAVTPQRVHKDLSYTADKL